MQGQKMKKGATLNPLVAKQTIHGLKLRITNGKPTKAISRLGLKLRQEEEAVVEVVASKRSTGSDCCLKLTRTQIEQ